MSNKALLLAVCREIAPMLDRLVLVGGCATELLITDTTVNPVRPTQDVDMIVEVLSLGDYYQLEGQLRSFGFSQTEDDQGVICRWTKSALRLDLMPTDEKILGFSNRWYPLAATTAQQILIDELALNLITAPLFIATKLEAFYQRGNADFLSSHDLEDLISVIDGHENIVEEVNSCPKEARTFLVDEFKKLIADSNFEDALQAHLPPDSASQARFPLLRNKLESITQL